MTIPQFATHYYLDDKRPFLNLSDLAQHEVDDVLEDLQRRHRGQGLQRVFGRQYMAFRRLTEARMRDLFISAGGRPVRVAPHYLVLGVSGWFEGLAPRMRSIKVALEDLPIDATSFTYPDSFTAMGFGPQFGVPREARPYHDRVFQLTELPDVIDLFGLPSPPLGLGYEGYERRHLEVYIEIQLWADEPIRAWLSAGPVDARRET